MRTWRGEHSIIQNTFNHFHPEGSVSKSRIINTNSAEDTNSTQGGISPTGNPCP